MNRIFIFGMALLIQGSLPSAKAQAALNLDQHLELARGFYRQDKWDSAIIHSRLITENSRLQDMEAVGNAYLILGKSLTGYRKYEQGGKAWSDYINILQSTSKKDLNQLIEAYCYQSENLLRWNKPQEMKQIFSTILELAEDAAMLSNLNRGHIKFLEGQYLGSQNKLQEGLVKLSEAMVLFRMSSDSNSLLMIRCITEAGDQYAYSGQSHNAIRMSLYAKSKAEKVFGKDSYRAGIYSNNLGLDYFYLRNFEKARFHYKLSERTIEKYKGKNSPRLAAVYVNLALLEERTNPNLALEYLHASERIFTSNFGKDSPRLVYPYHNIAVQYSFIGEPDKAMDYADRLSEVALKGSGQEKEYYAYSISLKGEIFTGMGKYAKAIKAYEEVERLYQKDPPDDPLKPLQNLNFKANCLFDQGEMEKARQIYDEVIRGLSGIERPKPYMESQIFGKLGQIAAGRKDWKEAIWNNDKALQKLEFDLNDEMSRNTRLSTHVLERLGERLLIYLGNYLQHPDEVRQDLDKTRQLTIESLRNLIGQAVDSEDRYLLRNACTNTAEVLLRSIAIIPMHERSEENYNDVLSIMELQKNSSLLSDIQLDKQLIRNLGDTELVKRDRLLKEEMRRLRSAQEEIRFTKLDENKSNQIGDSIFDLGQERIRFLSYIKANYQEYYEMVYGLDIKNITDLQNELKDNDLLLQYFFGDTNLYRLSITHDQVYYDHITLDSSFHSRLGNWLSNIKNPQSSMDAIEDDGCYLYGQLIEGSLKYNPSTDHILIINDGLGNYIPFEVLQNSCETDTSRYLNCRYSFGYFVSSSLAYKQFKKENSNKNTFSGYAADYNFENVPKIEALAVRSGGPILYKLPGAIDEIETIHKLVGGDIYLSTEATESNFKEHASTLDIIHLALHGRTNDYAPMQSGLLFNNSDTSDNGVLTTAEIYGLDLDAEIAVLSACETGLGKLRRGEGLQSISRAFSFAGANSTLYSLWKVPDKSTKEIMIAFYKGLKDGLRKDEALQKAKLTYLDNTVEPEEKHPYFWAGFLLQGDPDPIQFATAYGKNFYILIVFPTLCFLLLMLKNKRRWSNKF